MHHVTEDEEHPLKIKLLAALSILLWPLTAIADGSPLRLATTTTTANSGLIDYLLPYFTEASGIPVQVVAVGSGAALRLGEQGDVDVLLVHAPQAESAFVEAGHGIERVEVMHNDYVIVGPRSDPAAIANTASVAEALERIGGGAPRFVSRGDDSGTHRRELALRREAGLEAGGDGYIEVGLGMGRTLLIADQMQAYTLTDRGTWLAYRDRLDLELLFEGDPPLSNRYAMIAVNPARHAGVRISAARRLIEWISSAEGQSLIGAYRIDGQALFLPANGGS